MRFLSLALAIFARPAAQSGGPPPLLQSWPPVELEVERGWARLLEGDEVLSLLSSSGRREIRGPVHVELGPRSEVVIAWRGRMSVNVRGPAALWIAAAPTPLEPRVGLYFCASADLEVRRGTLHVALAGGLELEACRSAAALVENPRGELEIFHRGGEPLRLRGPSQESTRTLASGARIRLELERL